MDLGAVRVRVSESTAAINPSANTKPVMVAGITATQPRTADIAAPLQPMENQAKRSGLGVSRALAQREFGRGRRTPHGLRIYNSLTESAVEPEPPSVDATNDVVERSPSSSMHTPNKPPAPLPVKQAARQDTFILDPSFHRALASGLAGGGGRHQSRASAAPTSMMRSQAAAASASLGRLSPLEGSLTQTGKDPPWPDGHWVVGVCCLPEFNPQRPTRNTLSLSTARVIPAV